MKHCIRAIPHAVNVKRLVMAPLGQVSYGSENLVWLRTTLPNPYSLLPPFPSVTG